jgi:hypothetical protein
MSQLLTGKDDGGRQHPSINGGSLTS